MMESDENQASVSKRFWTGERSGFAAQVCALAAALENPPEMV